MAQGPIGNPTHEIFNRLLRDRIVFLGSEVDDDIANVICAQLLHLAGEDEKQDVWLYINSPGGSVTAGMAIYDTMQFIEPDVTDPPGLLMYSQTSWSDSSPARCNSCAQMTLAMSSSTSVPRKMMRSRRRRLKISWVGLTIEAFCAVGRIRLTAAEGSGVAPWSGTGGEFGR